jgi:dipeptidyl aminopeptidase/acylaminoacyl peptidase
MTRFICALGLVALAGAGGCSPDSTAPNPLDRVPDFVYVSNQNGSDQLFTYSKGTSTVLPGSVAGDIDPQSAHGRIVFTSFRDGPSNGEIYSAKNDGSDIQRLTNNPAADMKPSLSPDGTRIVFVSVRTSTPRLWAMAADGTGPTELATGSDEFTPESAPRFSPSGTQILFDSPRTGISQLYLMPAGRGAPVQLTHETNGAFSGSWSADGASVFYVDGHDRTTVHEIEISSGTVTDYVTGGTDVGDPVCTEAQCLVVSGVTASTGDILVYTGAGDDKPLKVVETSGNERQPAFLVP